MEIPSFDPEQERLDLMQYLGTLQISSVKEGPLWRLRSGLLSNAYNNGGIFDRYCTLLTRAGDELAAQLKKNNIKADVTIGAEKGSLIFSSYVQQSTGAHTNIYAEKMEEAMTLTKRELDTQQLLINLLNQKGINNLTIKPKTETKMLFSRHNIDIQGADIVICEDTITTGETTQEIINIIQQKGGNVVAIVCIGSRLKENNIQNIPIFSCVQIDNDSISYFHDDKTPEKNIGSTEQAPDGIEIIERGKIKGSWNK